MAKSNYPHKQRNGGSNRGALIALLVLLIIAAAVFLLRSCTDGKTPDPAPGGIVYDPGAVEGRVYSVREINADAGLERALLADGAAADMAAHPYPKARKTAVGKAMQRMGNALDSALVTVTSMLH